MADFVVKFSEPSSFSFKFGAKSAFLAKFGSLGASFDLKFGATPSVETYKGRYSARPSLGTQTLQTAQKFMKKNVTVLAIPVSVVSNPMGGNTVHIAFAETKPILGQAILGDVIL